MKTPILNADRWAAVRPKALDFWVLITENAAGI
jgi:hypothetical protein